MAGQIKYDEIFEPDILKKFVDEFEKAEERVKASVKNINKEAKKTKQAFSSVSGIKKTNDAIKKGTDVVNKHKQAQLDLTNVLKQKTSAEKALERQKQKALEKEAKAQAIHKQTIDLQHKEVKTIHDLQAKIKGLNYARNTQDRTTKEGQKQFAKLSKSLKNARKEMEKLDKEVGRNQRNVGNYFGAIKKLIGYFGVAVGGYTLIRAVSRATGVIIKFDKALTDLKAITLATGTQIRKLSDDAKRLGESTLFTASQVVQLQTELAKLGFTVPQILNATESILKLATITGGDLARNAQVAGNVIRAFGLSADDTGMVVDVMASSFTKSALDLEKFATAMRTVAPTAKTFGFSIQETTAWLAQLINAGADASMAGTQLRNILLNLANTNGDLAKRLGGAVTSADELIPALIKLRDEGVDLNETLQLTDKRSVSAFNTFLDGAENTKALTDALNEAGGTAERMAKIQLESISSKSKLLQSRWEGFILAIDDGNGVISQSIKGVLGLADAFLEAITPTETQTQKLADQYVEVNRLAIELKTANTTEARRLEILQSLREISPDIISGLDAENISIQKLNQNLRTYNELMIKRMAIASAEETLVEERERAGEAINERLDAEADALDAIAKIQLKIAQNIQDGADSARYQALQDDLNAIADSGGTVAEITDQMYERLKQFNAEAYQTGESQIRIWGMQGAHSALSDAIDEEADALNAVNTAFDAYNEKFRKIMGDQVNIKQLWESLPSSFQQAWGMIMPEYIRNLFNIEQAQKKILKTEGGGGTTSVEETPTGKTPEEEAVYQYQLQQKEEFNQRKVDLDNKYLEMEMDIRQRRIDGEISSEEEYVDLMLQLEQAKLEELIRLYAQFGQDHMQLQNDLQESYLKNQKAEEQTDEKRIRMKRLNLSALKTITNEETALYKVADATERAFAISEQLRALGLIQIKTAEGVAKTASAVPFPANIPLIAGFIAQVAGLIGSVAGVKFHSGTEYVKRDSLLDRMVGQDETVATLQVGERILDRDMNRKIGNISNKKMFDLIEKGRLYEMNFGERIMKGMPVGYDMNELKKAQMMMVDQQKETNRILKKGRIRMPDGSEVDMDGNIYFKS